MYECQGSYCIEYGIQGKRFRGVLDTGSPFLIIDGTACSRRWGCFEGQGSKTEFGDTYERYASQEGNVQWRKGQVELAGSRFSDTVFGVFREVESKGGEGAALVGLVKDANRGIRPTLLDQIKMRSMRFDFGEKSISLSRETLINPNQDVVKTIDVRRMGSPVRHYIVRVDHLSVNGQEVRSNIPILAMVDTGTTGLYMSEGLFYKILPESKGFRSCDVAVKTAGGHVHKLTASRPDPYFLAFPISFPWLDEKRAHIVVLGLAFLEKEGQVTFDLNGGKIAFGRSA
ncbi:hypothetical protein AAMO2058_000256400 [Amorphochlora amoebiformis]